jgi:hypothetical protein
MVGVSFAFCFFVCSKNPLGENHLDVVTRPADGRIRPVAYSSRLCCSRTVCSVAVALWFLLTISYAIVRCRDIEPWDWMMVAGSALVIVALALPDTFSRSWRNISMSLVDLAWNRFFKRNRLLTTVRNASLSI